MTNQDLTLKYEIKSALLRIDYRMMFFGAPFISLLCLMMVFAYHPDLMIGNLDRHLGFLVTIMAFLIGSIIGSATMFAVVEHYKPRVMRYVKAPDEIENMKDWIITFGAYLTTLDNDSKKTIHAKQLGKALYYTSKELLKIPKIESNIIKLETDVESIKQQLKSSISRKQVEEIIDDISAKTVNQQKELDKSQTRLDDY